MQIHQVEKEEIKAFFRWKWEKATGEEADWMGQTNIRKIMMMVEREYDYKKAQDPNWRPENLPPITAEEKAQMAPHKTMLVGDLSESCSCKSQGVSSRFYCPTLSTLMLIMLLIVTASQELEAEDREAERIRKANEAFQSQINAEINEQIRRASLKSNSLLV